MKYFGYKLAAWLATHLPRSFVYSLAWLVGWIHYLCKPRDRRGLAANLRHITHFSKQNLDDQQIRRMARQVFPNFCKNVADFFAMHQWSAEQVNQTVDFSDASVYSECLKYGKGLIQLTAHLGNWELAGRAVACHGYKINAVALNQATGELNTLFQGQRTAGGVNVIPMGRAARGCLEALKRNEMLAILADRDFTMARNLVTFFGRPARMPSGPARLAVATGAPVVLGACIRQPNNDFRIYLSEPMWPKKGPDAERKMQDAIARALETFIARWPTQWYLFHDFWDIERDLAISSEAFRKGMKQNSRPEFKQQKPEIQN